MRDTLMGATTVGGPPALPAASVEGVGATRDPGGTVAVPTALVAPAVDASAATTPVYDEAQSLGCEDELKALGVTFEVLEPIVGEDGCRATMTDDD